MNPLHLCRFAKVAQELSFSAAARTLDVDQATLSRQVRLLERELGFALFVRTTRAVRLTAEGEALLPEAIALADAMDAAQRMVALLSSENDARVRFGMHPFVYWSPQVRNLLDGFCTAGRGAVTTTSGDSARNLSRLGARTLDAALVIAGCTGPAHDVLPLMKVRPHLILPAEHPLAARASLDLGDLVGLRVATFRPHRDHDDFDKVYGPILSGGVDPVQVSEGAAAVVFHAVADRLAMISLRPRDNPAPDGFVRRALNGVQPVSFVLARLSGEDRGTLNRFWNTARRVLPN